MPTQADRLKAYADLVECARWMNTRDGLIRRAHALGIKTGVIADIMDLSGTTVTRVVHGRKELDANRV